MGRFAITICASFIVFDLLFVSASVNSNSSCDTLVTSLGTNERDVLKKATFCCSSSTVQFAESKAGLPESFLENG